MGGRAPSRSPTIYREDRAGARVRRALDFCIDAERLRTPLAAADDEASDRGARVSEAQVQTGVGTLCVTLPSSCH